MKRIRIAVLDTGYDPESVFFHSRERKFRVQGWKDLVQESDCPLDEDGHGTHVLSLAMRVAPAADVYAVRVARHTEDLQNASNNVATVLNPSRLYHSKIVN